MPEKAQPINPLKILVIRGGAIGDFILTLPTLAALRKRLPNVSLDILGYPRVAVLAVREGLAQTVLPIESPGLASFFTRNSTLDSLWAKRFHDYDLIISYIYDPEQIFEANIVSCIQSSARFIPCPHRPNEGLDVHATEFFLQPLSTLGITDADPVPRLTFASGSFAYHRVVAHPGSGSEKKNWPEMHWSQFLKRIIDETTLNLLLVGGEAEGDRLHRLAWSLPKERVQIAQHLPLEKVAEEMIASSFFIGHDSGISHLAAAIGMRGLILWGDTNLHVWRPRRDTLQILRHTDGLGELNPDEVFLAFEKLVGL